MLTPQEEGNSVTCHLFVTCDSEIDVSVDSDNNHNMT